MNPNQPEDPDQLQEQIRRLEAQKAELEVRLQAVSIDSNGGAIVGGSVNTSGGDFVSGDEHEHHHYHSSPEPNCSNRNIAQSEAIESLKKAMTDAIHAIGKSPETYSMSCPRRDLFLMLNISANEFKLLRKTLLQCGPFESNQKLRAVFAHPLLQPWQAGLPEAENAMDRVDILIDYLKNAYRDTGEPVLPIFLRILAERYDPQNRCYGLLSNLAGNLDHSFVKSYSDVQEAVGGNDNQYHGCSRSGDNAQGAGQHLYKNFFISYNSADRQWAEWIAWQLEEAGYSTVIQAWDFRPGNNFVLEMQKAAEQAERTIAVLSPNYIQALYTQPEWANAFAQDPTGAKQQLVPVRVKPCQLKGLLAQIVYIDLVDLHAEVARDMLLAGVDYDRGKPAVAPGFPGHL